MHPANCSMALDFLMKEAPNQDHYDSGYEGICPECRTCRFHRPFWKYQSCVFEECPYSLEKLPTKRAEHDAVRER